MKRKFAIVTILVLLLMGLTACNSQTSTESQGTDAGAEQSSEGLLNDNKSVEGEWTDGDFTLLTIEGDSVLVEHMGDSYVGSIDTSEKTITIKDGEHDDDYKTVGDAVFSYQIIKDKLVITTDSENWNVLGLDKTYSYERYVPTEESESTEDGE